MLGTQQAVMLGTQARACIECDGRHAASRVHAQHPATLAMLGAVNKKRRMRGR